MSRPATKMDILAAIEALDALPKPRGSNAQTMLAGYERAFVGKVSAEHLNRAVDEQLLHSTFFPSPSELYKKINRMEDAERRDQVRSKRLSWDEDKPKAVTGSNVFRPSSKRLLKRMLTDFGLEPEAFAPSLKGLPGLAVQMTLNRIRLKRPGWDLQPLTPRSLTAAVERMVAEMERRERHNDQPLLNDDPEAQERANQLAKMTGHKGWPR